jgi:hypothetical protein
METTVAGITFRIKENPEVANLRPVGAVTLQKEPDNKFDPNAIGVYYKGIQIGYIPKGKEQMTVNLALSKGLEVTARVNEYRYCDGDDFNDEHRGQLQYIKLELHSSIPEKREFESSFKKEIPYSCSLCGKDLVHGNFGVYCPDFKDERHKVGSRRQWKPVRKDLIYDKPLEGGEPF